MHERDRHRDSVTVSSRGEDGDARVMLFVSWAFVELRGGTPTPGFIRRVERDLLVTRSHAALAHSVPTRLRWSERSRAEPMQSVVVSRRPVVPVSEFTNRPRRSGGGVVPT